MRIAHNLSALNTSNKHQLNNEKRAKSTEKLSSGFRINRAADDAAGLAISERMRALIRGLDQASRNVQDGISLVQTAEGGLNEITEIIQRQRELIIQGLNDTYTAEDRQNIDDEIHQLTEEINSITNRTEFNTINLLARADYQILNDRSSHTVNVTTSGPFPKTTTSFDQSTSFLPIGTAEVPLAVQSSTTATTINDVNNHDSHILPITSPDGRQGYNEYEKNELIHTETTATDEYSYGRVLVSDPRYKELDVKYNTIKNVYFQTNLIPSGIIAGQYPDFGGFEDRFITVEIDGVPATLSDFSLKSSSITAGNVSAIYEKDGIEIEKVFSTTGSSFKVEFKIRNNSGIDNKQIKVSAAFQPEYDAKYSISSSNGVPVSGTATGIQIPDSGTAFELSNALVEYDFSFLSGGSYVKPDSVTTDSATLQSGDEIIPSWENTDFDSGAVLEFGISLDNFNFKKDVFLVTNEYTKEIDSIIQTVTTDIKDIDFIPPNIRIQAGAAANQTIYIPLFNVNVNGLGISNIGILPPAVPEHSLALADSALTKVTNYRSVYGAIQNRMESTMNNLGTSSENITAAESRIRDADIAKEMMELTKHNILAQTSQAMLAQANTLPEVVLQMLK
ncbi:flagellin [Brevibacillus sp. SYSU BS000544]|uniref:flagellin N-terminal helical domain-containing protein n=1 Tax=Brevibacillus sp. SYSU BS000544 TaxID=3416443 RepID=UPI003CE49E69